MGVQPVCFLPTLLPILLALTGCEQCKWWQKKDSPTGQLKAPLKAPAANPPMDWNRPSAAGPQIDLQTPKAPLSPANTFQPGGNLPAGSALVPNVSMKNKVNPESTNPLAPPTVHAPSGHVPSPSIGPEPLVPPMLIAPKNTPDLGPPPENLPALVMPPSTPEGPSGIQEPIRVQPPIDLPPAGNDDYGPPPMP